MLWFVYKSGEKRHHVYILFTSRIDVLFSSCQYSWKNEWVIIVIFYWCEVNGAHQETLKNSFCTDMIDIVCGINYTHPYKCRKVLNSREGRDRHASAQTNLRYYFSNSGFEFPYCLECSFDILHRIYWYN